MAPVKFYYMPESPPCRVVEFVATLLGIPLEKKLVDLSKQDQLKEDYVKLNPLHKIPFIVDGDLKMGESRAIIAYFVDKYAPDGSSLYPRDAIKRAQINELLFFEAGTLYQNQTKLVSPILFGLAKEIDPESAKTFKESLSYLENRLKANKGQKYLLGDELTIADVSIVIGHTLAEACEFDVSEFKEFCEYKQRVKSVPNFGEINDKAQEGVIQFIKFNRSKLG